MIFAWAHWVTIVSEWEIPGAHDATNMLRWKSWGIMQLAFEAQPAERPTFL